MTIFKSIVATFISILSWESAYAAEAPSYTVPLQEEENPKKDENPNNHGKRTSSIQTVLCVISTDGIQSPIDPDDILAYELWDEAGACLISTSEEKALIDLLYTLKGNLIIRIVTDDCVYFGYLSI